MSTNEYTTPHLVKYAPIQKGVLDYCQSIYFRQSLIKQYLTCPQQAFYDGIMGLSEQQPMMAAVLGTAGHKVIFDIHEERLYGIDFMEVCNRMTKAFYDEVGRMERPPRYGSGFDSVEDDFNSKLPQYASMVLGYAQHKETINFHSTLHEQSFVLTVSTPPGSNPTLGSQESEKPFIFTGQIDQAGYDEDGAFVLRDIKFRQNDFKPSFAEFNLDIQMTIYCYALRHGVPACAKCKPRYNEFDYEMVYNGPCSDCAAKIKTPAWPGIYPTRAKLIWMRDYLRREKDEYAKYIPDPKKRRATNPATGKMKIIDVINPKWVHGAKAGDYAGPGFILTHRAPQQIEVLMSDVIRVARSIREGQFFRHPSKEKCFFCRHSDACKNHIETEAELHSPDQLGVVANPFEHEEE